MKNPGHGETDESDWHLKPDTCNLPFEWLPVQRICVDMDEVMADTLAEHIRRYNQTFDEEVTPEDPAGKGLWEITPLDRQAQLRAFLDAEDFFEVLDVIPGRAAGAQRAFRAL